MRWGRDGVGHRSGRPGLHHSRFGAAARIAIAALILSGCGRNPAATAGRYLESLHRLDYPRCYAMLTDQDRQDRTMAEFLTEIPLAPDVGPALFRPVMQNVRFELGEVHRDGGRASVAIKVTAPDLPLWERALNAAAGADQPAGQNAQRSLESGDFPKVIDTDTIFLIKEHHHWRVVAGFTVRDRIVDLHREAIVEYHQYEYGKVIQDYQSMIGELDRASFTGAVGLAARYRAELAAVQAAQADIPAATAYMNRSLTLSEIAMRMSEERVPAIFGSITNHGDRALDSVQIAVNWYEGHGKSLKAVYTEKHPIVITPIEFTDFSVPVMPFVTGEKRSFGLILTAPVQVQQEAAPYVTISAIAFTYLKAPLPKLASVFAPKEVAGSGPGTSSPAGVAVAKRAPPPLPSPAASPDSAPSSSIGDPVP